MSQIELKIRKMKTGETLIACFESEADALTWLRDRPEFIDVLGTANPNIDPETGEKLRSALRPLDPEEKAFLEEEKRKNQAEREAQERAEAERAALEKEAHRQRMAQVGSNEPMTIRWTVDKGFMKSDPDDPREITDAAKKAIEAWLAERRTWIPEPKVLCEALVTVWPGVVPTGSEDDRIHEGGHFAAGFLEDGSES